MKPPKIVKTGMVYTAILSHSFHCSGLTKLYRPMIFITAPDEAINKPTGMEMYGLNLKVSRCLMSMTPATINSTVKDMNIVSNVLRSIY